MIRKFKVMAGSHFENNINYKVGDVVSSELNLADLFGAAKFQTVHDTTPGALATVGEDVTANYPIAMANGLKVYRDGKAFSVNEGDAVVAAFPSKPGLVEFLEGLTGPAKKE